MSLTLDKNLGSSVEAATKGQSLVAVPLLYLDFPSLAKYFAGSSTNIEIRSSTIIPAATYIGVGGISAISAVEESSDFSSTSLTAELNGIDSTYVAMVLGENYFGRDASLALGVLDNNYKIVGDPILLFKGFMSLLETSIEKEAKFTVKIESMFGQWERPRVLRYNTATQKTINANDRGFDNVAPNVNKEITWG